MEEKSLLERSEVGDGEGEEGGVARRSDFHTLLLLLSRTEPSARGGRFQTVLRNLRESKFRVKLLLALSRMEVDLQQRGGKRPVGAEQGSDHSSHGGLQPS